MIGRNLFIRTFLGHNVRAAIAHREIQFAVRSHAQSVQIMAEESHAHAEPLEERLLRVGHAVLVLIAKRPQVRDVGVVDRAVAREQAGANSLLDAIEAVGINGGMIGFAVVVLIPDKPHPIGLLGIIDDALALVAFHDLDPLVDGRAGKFLVQPAHVLANVRHAGMETKCFGDKEAPFLIDGERDGIGQQRFRSEQLDLESLRDAEPP
jgi:hypothetical protein